VKEFLEIVSMAVRIEFKINIQTYAITVVGNRIKCLKNTELKLAI